MTKRLVILGGGESGTGAAILGKKKGYNVFLSDNVLLKQKYKEELAEHRIDFEEGNHTLERILSADEVVKSPGIPDNAELIKNIEKKKINVISEIEFASRYTKAKMICITGSNGKTTTTLLTYHILKNAGLNVGLAGNVGKSLARQVAMDNYDCYVLELSSFQLDGMFKFRANIAILLNITPDHLDRYDHDMKKYVDSKFRVSQNMKSEDHFIYCQDDPVLKEEIKFRSINAKKIPVSIINQIEEGAFTENDQIIFKLNNKTETIMSIQELALQGKHNLYNSMAAGIASRVLEIKKNIIRESLTDFENIEHRLEIVGKVHGIEFINDSKATNVNSTWYALECTLSPIIWIVGGVDKGNDYSELMDLVKTKVKAIICLGKDNKKIHEAFGGIVSNMVDARSAREAVAKAYQLGKKGDTVLLSPACASFDLFENYEDRGKQFKNAVKAL